MNIVILLIVILIFLIFVIIKNYNKGSKDGYNRNTDGYDRGYGNSPLNKEAPKPKASENKKKYQNILSNSSNKKIKPASTFRTLYLNVRYGTAYNQNTINWAVGFFSINDKELVRILSTISTQYSEFKLRKRKGGYRTIASPNTTLLSLQRTIYQRILLSAQIHSRATGFRQGVSIVDNAKPHLGKQHLLKADIHDFFGTIAQKRVQESFEKIGYPADISQLLAILCCLHGRLPQGAPTSPAISNIVAYTMDVKLLKLAQYYGLEYTRYADDLTFSGDSIIEDKLLPKVRETVRKQGFSLNNKKTKYIAPEKRKIVTGISISSGEKLTIPKQRKREIRQSIHYILTRGVELHQKKINSTDPTYLRRTIGYLNFWHSVEPENQYVINSMASLKKLESRKKQ